MALITGPAGLILLLVLVAVASWLIERIMILTGKVKFVWVVKIIPVVIGVGLLLSVIIGVLKTIGGLLGA